MNENYTAQEQMQKGFKTFLLTLSVSLIIFSVIYYFISDGQTVDSQSASVSESVVASASTTEDTKNTDTKDSIQTPVIAQNDSDKTGSSVFAQISAKPITDSTRAVLAGATTSPTGTGRTGVGTTGVRQGTMAGVPSSGVTELTWGFFISLVAFVMGFVVISRDPRKMAIKHFEDKMLDK